MYKVFILQCVFLLIYWQSSSAQISVASVLRTMQIDTNFVYNDSLLIQIQNTNIYIQIPNNFYTTPDAPIVSHSGTSTTFEFKEYSAVPYIYINEVILREDFSKQNVELLSSQEITLENGNTGILYFFSFISNGREFERITLLTGDYHNTIWVDASCLKQFIPYMESLIVKSLKTIQFNNSNQL